MRFVAITECHEVGIDVDTMATSENEPPRCGSPTPGWAAQANEFVQELFDRERNRDEKRTPTY